MTEDSSRKPTPVRETLRASTPTEDVRFASLSFETGDGEAWVVEELGWTRSGRREDPGAPLLLLGFRPEGAEEMVREALVPARRLSDVPEQTLPSILLGAARAFQGQAPDRPFFSGARGRTRDGRGRRSRSRE